MIVRTQYKDTVGRPGLNPTLRKVIVQQNTAGEIVAVEDTGYYVTFSAIPLKFFIHPQYNRKERKNGFALTEESTGMRVAWALTDHEVLQLGADRINDYLRRKGLKAFLRMVEAQPKITSLKKGYNGINDKSDPADDPSEDVRAVSTTGGKSKVSSIKAALTRRAKAASVPVRDGRVLVRPRKVS